MEYLVTAEEMKRYDQTAIHTFGIPALVLMERAALSAAEEILWFMKQHPKKDGSAYRLLIGAGMGNNGADGLALARILSRKAQVEVVCIGQREHATAQWEQQYEILKNYPVQTGSNPVADEYDIVVDALFGVGLSREITGSYREWIERLNGLKGWKVALDVPSGIHSDHGRVMGCAFRADLTVCFAFRKRGLLFYPGCLYAGNTLVKEIGIDEQTFGDGVPQMFRLTEEPEEVLPVRVPDGNKGSFGKVLMVAGSNNMAGAALLCGESCLRTGAGMVKLVSPGENRVIIQTALLEALYTDVLDQASLSWADVLVIGPGIGQSQEAKERLVTLLQAHQPLVVDADGLNLISGELKLQDLLRKRAQKEAPVILTPHVGELSRLIGKTIAEIKEYPVRAAQEAAEAFGCIVVSKDARTLICQQNRQICMNAAGDHGMATAGSGDVLAGIIAGLLAQGMEGFQAACVGAYLHGKAGEEAARRFGSYSMKAGDLITALKSMKGRKENS